jgi:nitrogen regulatory protein P-II 1
MKYRKVTAIINTDKLESVEARLQEIGVPGLSVTKVKGYGEYADFYSRDWMTQHARIEIFTVPKKVDAIVQTIIDTAQTGNSDDGIVVVLPVEKVYRIRTRALAEDDTF